MKYMKAFEFFEQAKIKYNGFFQYNESSFIGMKKKMEIICPKHGIFMQSPYNHLISKFGCPLCANENKKKRVVFTDKERVGLKTVTNAGFEIECIAYRRSDDITVRFSDGTEVVTAWHYFQSGAIDHPNHKNYRKPDISRLVGVKGLSTYKEPMTIIAARSSEDIDVEFSDGSIAYNKRYDAFRRGEIKRPTQTVDDIFQFHKNHRLSETKLQKCGLMATIVEYEKTYIVVKFENGRKRKSTYSQFAKGSVQPPKRRNKYDKPRIGEKRILKDGHTMEIIRYDSSQHIIVLIDGVIEKKTDYACFQKAVYVDANSQRENMSESRLNSMKLKRIGETKKQKYTGEKMTIIDYAGNSQVTVQFEDGTIVNDVRYQNFNKGLIMNPNRPNRSQVSLNEYTILYYLSDYGFIHANRGTLKEYGLGMMEIDIFHPELKIGIEYDGRMHKKNMDLKKNRLCKENGINLYRIQEPNAPVLNVADCYRLNDCTAFSDNLLETLNTIIDKINNSTLLQIKHVTKFNKNKIQEKFYEYTYDVNDIVGLTRNLENGDIITIVRYGGCNDVDFSLSNGKIIKHKNLQSFKELKWARQKEYTKAYWEGQSQIVNGRLCTIKNYTSCTDITVSFDDGVTKKISKAQWDNGKISHPDDKLSLIRIGERNLSLIGLEMEIVEYFDCFNLTIKFSDERFAHNVNYESFKTGHVTPDGTNITAERLRLQRIGETYKTNSGKVYKIIDYISSSKTLIEDENGFSKYCSYHDLKRGKIS